MHWAGAEQGRKLLSFVFNVGLPILVFGALAGVPLAREHALLPVAAICISLLGWGAAAWVARRFFQLPRTGEGAMALCAMSLNNSMLYPFAALSLGAAAFSELVMFDMGHAVLVWTVTTVVACKYGGHADDIRCCCGGRWRRRRCGCCSLRWGSTWAVRPFRRASCMAFYSWGNA
jgi:predicted permease